MAEYERVAKGDDLFPPVNAHYPPMFTVASGNHMTLIARAFLDRGPTTPEVCKLGLVDDRGRLCLQMIMNKDPDVAAYIRGGLRCKRLKASLCDYPHQIRALASGMNNDMKLNKTEVGILKGLQAELFR